MEKISKARKTTILRFHFFPNFRVMLHCFMYGKLTEFDILQSFDPEDVFFVGSVQIMSPQLFLEKLPTHFAQVTSLSTQLNYLLVIN